MSTSGYAISGWHPTWIFESICLEVFARKIIYLRKMRNANYAKEYLIVARLNYKCEITSHNEYACFVSKGDNLISADIRDSLGKFYCIGLCIQDNEENHYFVKKIFLSEVWCWLKILSLGMKGRCDIIWTDLES